MASFGVSPEAWVADEYGRHPSNPKYEDKRQRQKEWDVHLRAQREWARKRAGRSVAHLDSFSGEDIVGDKLMQEYLEKEGLMLVADSSSTVPPEGTT